MVKGRESTWGSLSCGCHPNCGVGTALMINKETKEWAPVPRFLNATQLTKDVTAITDAARGKNLSNFMMAMALLKNYRPFEGPKGLTLFDLFKKFDKTWALTKRSTTKYGRTSPDRNLEDAMKRRKTDPWNFLFIAGMWFQDLFNYDFRRTEQCIIPYATQEGEISFCAYNTGVGWRNIIEKMHMTATLTKWYDEHGRHEIFAGNHAVPLAPAEHHLILNAEAVAAGEQHDLDKLGIAKNAREEKIRERNEKLRQEGLHNDQMMKLYRQVVLKEKTEDAGFVPLNGIAGLKPTAPKKPADDREAVGSFGD